MKHGVKGAKFGKGYDSNKMLLRKLVYNFFMHGKIITTEKKVKAMKPLIDRLVTKLRTQNEANKNYILSYINNPKMIKAMYEQITPALKTRTSGFVRNIKLEERISDGSLMARLEWVDPVTFEYGQKTKATRTQKTVKKEVTNLSKKEENELTKRLTKKKSK